MIVRKPHDEKRDRAEQDPHKLFGIKRERNPLVMRHAINRQNAQTQDGKDQSDKTEIEVIDATARDHPVDHLVPCPPASRSRATTPSVIPEEAGRSSFIQVSI